MTKSPILPYRIGTRENRRPQAVWSPIDIATGNKLWSAPAAKPACLGTPGCSGAQPAPVALIPEVVFSGALDGHMRAYDARTGATIWELATAREFDRKCIKARGRSMNGSGPVVAGGMVFANSGYSRLPIMPGNILLAFSVDGT
jgi:polyvinyl alcohol dehydrogenase (cytochrome)